MNMKRTLKREGWDVEENDGIMLIIVVPETSIKQVDASLADAASNSLF
jgi:hypothetical protein